jgi:hypothetical protein
MPTVLTKPDTRAIQDGDQNWKNWDWSAHDNCAHIPNAELLKTIEDVEAGRNLIGPFATAAEAFRSMMEGMEALDDEEDEEDEICTP